MARVVRSAAEWSLRLMPPRAQASRRSSPRGLRAFAVAGLGQFRFTGFARRPGGVSGLTLRVHDAYSRSLSFICFPFVPGAVLDNLMLTISPVPRSQLMSVIRVSGQACV